MILPVIEALLEAGADATAQDIDGNTPWDYAKDREELQGSDAYQRLSEAQALAADLEESGSLCGVEHAGVLRVGDAGGGEGLPR